jgi:diadenosine tetraphosphatase ApaH/serine/threonine PP2A family protein phosphatase
MRVAVISDIHSNLPALEAVLDDIDRLDPEPDSLWCLGDIVGYGAQPETCTALMAERAEVCLAGNHDLVVSGELDIENFTSSAAEAARWTTEQIDGQTRSFLEGLSPLAHGFAAGLYHASPRDPVWEYVLSIDQARACLLIQEERVCLIGHSHVACHFATTDGETYGEQAYEGTTLDLGDDRWLVNPGSVGQPRDGDARAAYLLLDTDGWDATFRRVEYPIDDAARAIIDAGLPRDLAARLYVGR